QRLEKLHLVHLRKVDWAVGARWMYAHLLDGDLASNTLSWQWVAGTWTGKPYLFNAENVARYTPKSWQGRHNTGTAIDRRYDQLERFASSSFDAGPEPIASTYEGFDEPSVFTLPPPETCSVNAGAKHWAQARYLIHPWCLHLEGAERSASIGILLTDFHAQYPWSEQRWRWVLSALSRVTCAL
ncbi:MAG: FAD-binding domain-containing protein, partial [Burkholderiales bacterium]|nr:FAD-binding domain-containing protein [Burkholderiales bacterium]